ncbi:MAG: DUF1559 domain-containing protein [Rubripirellula sp.]|nr:DUF1559 domain-containing protein [Rubripirellula sp.]
MTRCITTRILQLGVWDYGKNERLVCIDEFWQVQFHLLDLIWRGVLRCGFKNHVGIRQQALSTSIASASVMIMSFLFTCPHCHTSTQVDDCYSGHEGACVTCGKAIQIPDFESSGEKRAERSRKYSSSMFLGIGFFLVILTCLGFLLIRTGGDTIQRMATNRVRSESASNLRKIAAALNAYARDHGTYPPPVVKVGTNTHSWRILILPYLNENALHDRYDFDQSWDSEANMIVAGSIPAVFRNSKQDPGFFGALTSQSDYYLITGPGTLFPSTGPLSPDQIRDDAGQTLLLVEARRPGQEMSLWTFPGDIKMNTLRSSGYGELGGVLAEGFAFATVDEKVRFMTDSSDPLVIGAVISANGGERLPSDVFD